MSRRTKEETQEPDVQEDVEAPTPPDEAAAPDGPSEDAGASSQGPAADGLEAALRAAIRSTLSGGPIARNTDCWNALDRAIPAIVKSINRQMLQEG